MPKTVTRNELHSLINNAGPPILIEALPEKYYAQGHLPGAKHLPHDQVNEKMAEVAPDKDAAIVVYCASIDCRNSHLAAADFEALGYTNIAVFPGGKKDWEDAGLPLERE